jgi:hypothetical protein
MARVRHPNLQDSRGRYLQMTGAVTAVTNRDTELPADAYTAEEGGTAVTYPVDSGAEGEVNIWVPVGAYETTFGDDTVDTPAVWEAISGEELANMLTIDDIPALPGGGMFSPLDFGGDPTGDTDSTAALSACFAAANAVNGTIHLGGATNIWSWSSTLNFPQDCRMTSYGGGMGGSGAMATLRWDGTGSAGALSFADRGRWEIDHVRFQVADPTYTGPVLNVTHAVVDPAAWHIHHCEFDFDFGGPEVPVFKAYIRLHKAITGRISECHFNGGMTHVLMGDPANTASYCNAVHLSNNSHNDCFPPENGQILIGARDMQACSISNSVFSGGGASGYVCIRGTNTTNSSGGAGASGGDASSNSIYTLHIDNNYFGDGSTAEAMIDGLNTQTDGPILLTNNFMADSYDVGFRGGQNGAGVVAIGNDCFNAPLFGTWDGTAGEGNKVFGFGNKVSEGFFKAGEDYTESARFGRGGVNWITGRMGIIDHADFDDPALWDASEIFVQGGKVPNTAGMLAIGARIAAYNRTTATAGNNHTIQAGQADNLSEVQLVAGTTPSMRMRANGVGIAFNGNAPIAKPTGVGVDAASIHAALVSLGLISG